VIQQFTFYPPTDFPIGERNLLWCVDYGVLELWTNGDFVARYKYNESRNIYELDRALQPVEPDLTDLKECAIRTERLESFSLLNGPRYFGVVKEAEEDAEELKLPAKAEMLLPVVVLGEDDSGLTEED